MKGAIIVLGCALAALGQGGCGDSEATTQGSSTGNQGGGPVCEQCGPGCDPCPPTCGDGLCSSDEDCSTCDVDCGACDACADAVCGDADDCCITGCTIDDDVDCESTSTSLIPEDRRIAWQPGVPGGIPEYPIGINVKDAPYGAAGDGSADDTAAIQQALDDCPTDTAVYLPAGTYRVSGDIMVGSHCVLRGDGPGQTVLNSDSGSYAIVMIGDSSTAWNQWHEDFYEPWVDLTSDGQKGSTTFEVSNAADFGPGDMVLIDQLNDPPFVDAEGQEGLCNYCDRAEGTRSLGQMAIVTGVSGNTVTIDRPLHWTFETALAAQANPMDKSRVVEYAGVEDLTITQPNPTTQYNVFISGAAFSWLSNVEVMNIDWRAVWTAWSLGGEIRDSYVHTGINEYGHSHGYGVTISLQSTAFLVENNVFDHVCYSTVVFGGANGNVIAYNYMGTTDYSFGDDWLVGGYGSHGAHPMMNLWEGNKGAKVYYDFIHGSASHETFYRNHLRAWQPDRPDANFAMGFEEHNTFMNVVANILGDAGKVTMYEQNASSSYDTWTPTVFFLGSPSADAQVENTILRPGNFDAVNNCVYDPDQGACIDVDSLDLPASLYRSGKPGFFGDTPWPPIGPDVDGNTVVIPAEARFQALNGG